MDGTGLFGYEGESRGVIDGDQQKEIIVLDGITLNGAYMVSGKEINLSDVEADTAMAYAKSLKGAMRAVAIERVETYEAHINLKLPLKKLKDRLQKFMQEGKSEAWEKWYKLYLSAGGNEDFIT